MPLKQTTISQLVSLFLFSSFFSSVSFLLLINPLQAQNLPYSAAEKQQLLNQLPVFGSVLYVAAHPDDENTRLLAYLANERGFRTGYLSLTRGDGGQNLIGNEQSEELGLIRTQELLAARRVDRAEQFFTRAFDFGYSKNPEETFQIWNKNEILSDVVWAIRKFKPDVIITRFPTTGEGGHGHHTASAILALEAFDAAANPKQFPEQLKDVSVWQAKRIFWNNFMPSRDSKTNTDGMLKLDVGLYNSALGLSYGEIAAQSRSQHKSQGFGVKEVRGEILEFFTLLKGEKAENDIFDKIDTKITRIDTKSTFQKELETLQNLIKNGNQTGSVAHLFKIRKQVLTWKDDYWKQQKLKQIDRLILGFVGLKAEFCPKVFEAAAGDEIKSMFSVINRSELAIQLKELKVDNGLSKNYNQTLANNKLFEDEIVFQIPEKSAIHNPYWLRKPVQNGRYDGIKKQEIGQAELPASFQFQVLLQIGDDTISHTFPAYYKWVDPVKGELHRSFVIKPKVIAEVSNKILVFNQQDRRSITLNIQSNLKNKAINIKPILPSIWVSNAENFTTNIDENGKANLTLELSIRPTREIKPNQHQTLLFEYEVDGKKDTLQSITRIDYDHIPMQTWIKPLQVDLVFADLIGPKTKIAYLEGAGDRVAECLAAAGYAVDLLNESSISKTNLSQYTAIFTGIRTYNTIKSIQQIQPLLMNYVSNGGHLIVQYNTKNWISDVAVQLGPFPFEISRNRVTEENAPVKILATDHPFFTTPNAISALDFDGWIQERGLYFPEKVDERYEKLLEMNDRSEPANNTSLITAPFGKGRFTYMSLSMFRQLPAGVPGAYRLIQNIIQSNQH